MALNRTAAPPAALSGGAEGEESRTRAWSLTLLLVALYVINWSDKAVLGLVAQPLSQEFGALAVIGGVIAFLAVNPERDASRVHRSTGETTEQ